MLCICDACTFPTIPLTPKQETSKFKKLDYRRPWVDIIQVTSTPKSLLFDWNRWALNLTFICID